MKNFLFVLPLLISLQLYGQNYPDPDYLNQPYLLNSENTLVKLERGDAQFDFKIKGLGYGGYDMFYTVFGMESDTKVSFGSPLVFLVKLDTKEDPSTFITLTKGNLKREKRNFIFDSRSMMGKSKDISENNVPVDIAKLENGIFRITTKSTLEVGQYAFKPIGVSNAMVPGKQTIFCFSIE
ncbi:MAG: hypothetical protein QNK51_02235 [Chitinophagales bacterium]|tara:strand:- start:68 stop:610 length:543 start_codon:yes stop_codon:yes gene_type:complete